MYERDGRGRKSPLTRLGFASAVGLVLALAGCSYDYVTEDEATVNLYMTSINEGSPIVSDIRNDAGSILNCQVVIGVASLLKNPANPGSALETVVLQRYDVSFTRSDGRAVEGVDVPYRFSAAMTGTVEPNQESTFTIDLIRHQAKLEPPLNSIQGAHIVEMTANVTLYGQTVSRKNVSASGAAAIRFADFLGEDVGCEYEEN